MLKDQPGTRGKSLAPHTAAAVLQCNLVDTTIYTLKCDLYSGFREAIEEVTAFISASLVSAE